MSLADVIEEQFDRPVDVLDGAALHAELLDLERASQQLEALKARCLGAWVSSLAWTSDGSKAPGARLARDAHRSPTATRAEVRVAKALATMPATRAAFEAGHLAVEHVHRLADANRPAFRARFTEAEPMLVSWATTFAFDDFATAIATWIQVADDDAAEDRATKAHQDRSASCAPTIGGVRDVQARLDPVGGAIFQNELFRLERSLFETDWAEAQATHGEATQADHLARTPAQRRADALVLMAERSAALPPGSTPGRVLLSVLIDYPTLTGRLCELMDGTAIAPGQLLPYLDRTDLERLVFAGRSRVIEVGAHTPFFTGALRRTIEIRDRHCQFPGCREPAERCDVDHITERCNGGPTTQDNGRLLCPTHNRQRPGRRPTSGDPPDREGGPGRASRDGDRSPP